MSSPLVSSGPLLSLRCSARVHNCLRLLVSVVDWCVSLLVRLICYRIILTASSPGRPLISRSLAHPSPGLTTFAFRSREVRHLLLDLDPYGGVPGKIYRDACIRSFIFSPRPRIRMQRCFSLVPLFVTTTPYCDLSPQYPSKE